MSKSDKLSIAVGTILAGLGFVVDGPLWGFGLLIFGLIYLVAFWHHEPDPTLSLGAISPSSPQSPSGDIGYPPTHPKTDDIDGELYRLALVPRTAAWEILKAAFKMEGREDEAAIDCDVLVEMYLVNKSTKDKFVRELRLSSEIGGVRTNFAMQTDFKAKDMLNKQFEYSLDLGHDFYAPDVPLDKLFTAVPFALSPQQPLEGWVRFFIRGINPDKIDRSSWQVTAVDSVGNEFPITQVGLRKRDGEVSIRRLRS